MHLSVTFAAGTLAPLASKTTPETAPVFTTVCDRVGAQRKMQENATKAANQGKNKTCLRTTHSEGLYQYRSPGSRAFASGIRKQT